MGIRTRIWSEAGLETVWGRWQFRMRQQGAGKPLSGFREDTDKIRFVL